MKTIKTKYGIVKIENSFDGGWFVLDSNGKIMLSKYSLKECEDEIERLKKANSVREWLVDDYGTSLIAENVAWNDSVKGIIENLKEDYVGYDDVVGIDAIGIKQDYNRIGKQYFLFNFDDYFIYD